MAQHFANGREQGQFEEERAHVTPVEEGHTHARRTRKHAPRQTQSKQGKQKERKNWAQSSKSEEKNRGKRVDTRLLEYQIMVEVISLYTTNIKKSTSHRIRHSTRGGV